MNLFDIAKYGGSVAAGIIGVGQAAKAAREANKQLDNMQRMENARYYSNMGDSLHRADVAELGKTVYDNVRAVNEQALNPITNNTVEGANAIRQQNAKMAQQMASTVNADNTRIRMENENRHTANMGNVATGRAQISQNKAAQITKATSDTINALLAEEQQKPNQNLFDGMFTK